jgi:hypothetical protein
MKNFELKIRWDRLRQGEFPLEEFKETDENAQISIEKLTALTQKITISTLIEEEENELEIAYEIGSYLNSIVSRRYA